MDHPEPPAVGQAVVYVEALGEGAHRTHDALVTGLHPWIDDPDAPRFVDLCFVAEERTDGPGVGAAVRFRTRVPWRGHVHAAGRRVRWSHWRLP